MTTIALPVLPTTEEPEDGSLADVIAVYGHACKFEFPYHTDHIGKFQLTCKQVFGVVPSLEHKISHALRSSPTAQVIVDFSNAWRCETCIGQMIRAKIDEFRSDIRPRPFIFTGLPADSSLSLDLGRGGVSCVWPQVGPVSEEYADAVECYYTLYDGISSTHNGAYMGQWLERLFLDFDIGELLKSQRATIHQFAKGQGVELHGMF